MVTINVNGVQREIQSPADTPLLYVLRNDLELSGPQFGCGLAQCGSCSVLLDGKEIRSCITPLSAASGKVVTTLEGLPARWAQQKNLPSTSVPWPTTRQPQCSHTGAIAWIAHSRLSKTCCSPAALTSNALS